MIFGKRDKTNTKGIQRGGEVQDTQRVHILARGVCAGEGSGSREERQRHASLWTCLACTSFVSAHGGASASPCGCRLTHCVSRGCQIIICGVINEGGRGGGGQNGNPT